MNKKIFHLYYFDKLQNLFFSLTVLLASFNILGPVTAVCVFVVKQATDAKLLSGGSIPTCPVARAACLMAKDSIQPVAVLGGDRPVGQLLALAVVGSPGIVTSFGHSAMFTGKHQTVGTVVKLWYVVNALPVTITVLYITHHL